MPLLRATLLIALSAGVALACAGSRAPSPQSPTALLETLQLVAGVEDWERAYALAQQIDREHPDSAERDQAYPIACHAWQRLWYRARYAEPDSVWKHAERDAMFHWAASYFTSDGGFPQEETEELLKGLPWSMGQEFLAWAADRPDVARWAIAVEEDNGRIEGVSGLPASSGPPDGSAGPSD
jgi:hypothetical protein